MGLEFKETLSFVLTNQLRFEELPGSENQPTIVEPEFCELEWWLIKYPKKKV